MNGKTRPVLAIMAAASLWGFIGLFSYILMFYGFSPVQVIAVRTIAGSLFMTAFLLVRSPALLKINPRDIWMFIGTGIISLQLLRSAAFRLPLCCFTPRRYLLCCFRCFYLKSGSLSAKYWLYVPPFQAACFYRACLPAAGSARRKLFLQVFFPVLAMLCTAFSANMRLLNIIRQPFPSGLFIWPLCLCCRFASRRLC